MTIHPSFSKIASVSARGRCNDLWAWLRLCTSTVNHYKIPSVISIINDYYYYYYYYYYYKQ